MKFFIDQKAREVLSNNFESVSLSQTIKFLWSTTIATTGEGYLIPNEKKLFAKALKNCEAQSNVLVIRQSDGSNQCFSVQCLPVIYPNKTNPCSVVCYISNQTVNPMKSNNFFNQLSISNAWPFLVD